MMQRPLRTLLIGLAAIVYAVIFGEMFIRVVAPEPLMPRYVTGAPDGVRANMSNVAFRQWTPEVDVTIRYNDRGMRDDRPAPPLAKSVGECRVALLGDSYFVGFESEYPQSFAKQLEDRLAASGKNVRVLNFAVSGFGTAEDLVVLNSRVAPWRPDVVVMSWHASDPDDNIRSNLYRLVDGTLRPTGQPFLPGIAVSDRLMESRIYRWLIENSQIYSAVRERAGVFTKSMLAKLRRQDAQEAAADDVSSIVDMPPPPEPVTFGPPLLDRALVEATRDTSTAMGAHFLLFEIPTRSTRTFFKSPLEKYLPDLAGVDVSSPMAAFANAARPDLKLYQEEGQLHWTDAGNALAAEVAAADIIRRGWLDACSGVAATEKAPTAP
jgi:hypothetical protein